MRFLLPLAFLLVAGACESDETKLRRLQVDETVAAVTADYWQHRLDSLSERARCGWDVRREIVVTRDSLSAARDRLTLRRRELNRFLR